MDVQAIDPSRAAAPGTTQSTPPVPGGFKLPTGFPVAAAQQDETLHKALAQLVGSDVAVSFQVVKGTHDIVTVFKSKATGQVISQFPPEAMVLIAQFFNKLAGAVLDRKA
jgi:FlaG protein